MIRIKHNAEVQKFALTLTELTTLVNPNYLFVFTCDVTKEIQKVVLPDLSERKSRYNLFELPGNYFASEGWYSYAAYQQTSEDNLDPEEAAGIVEEGRVFVESINPVTFIENNSQTNFKEYVG